MSSFKGPLQSKPPPHTDERLLDELLEGAADFLCKRGLRVSLVQREGTPKQVLWEEAAQWSAQSIFLGRGPRRGLNRWLLGSTSAAIAAQARCTVEVVRESKHHPALARHDVRVRSLKLAAQSTAH